MGDNPSDDDQTNDFQNSAQNSQKVEFLSDKQAEVGIIESIRLDNFMCHQCLEIDFGPNVNFIVGQNGSGKSAVLTGIAVCLGSKTTFTNRGSALKDLIKKDCNHASITIKLRNRGEDAFQPEKYGKTITIERRITKEGSGSYKLKDSSGKRIISTKKR